MPMSYANVKLSVPNGFRHLLEDLSREILREQPKDIPKFAAVYFQRMVEKRKGSLLFQFCLSATDNQ